ncbi:MAG: helix-turn-helix domain-containing protein [Bacteroidota bacterium]
MASTTIILVLSCLGIAQALFLCAYLFTLQRGNRRGHFFLALLILGLTIRIGKSILNTYLPLEPWQRNLGIAGILLVGPSLWFYGKALFHQRVSKKLLIPHFIPYVLFSLFCWGIPNRFDTLSLTVYYIIFGHLMFYLWLAIRLFLKQKDRSQKLILVWYRNLIFGVLFIWVFYMGNVSGLVPFYIGGAISYTFLVYVFSFLLLRKHTFQLEKYQGQRLEKSISKNVLHSLNQLFRDEKTYLNHQINLAEIAKRLKTTPRVLSRVINESTGKNFSEFVNYHRIEHAKSLLCSDVSKHEKIASIAFDSGFNNVTSFNLAFKAMTHLTPSQFKKQFN